jgi:antitoxin HigA-1
MSYERRHGPGWAVHPGEILREEFMKPRKITAYRLARALHLPVPRINDIVLERRGITAATALRLAKFFGTTEQFWMNLQSAYEIYHARRASRGELEKIAPLARDTRATA